MMLITWIAPARRRRLPRLAAVALALWVASAARAQAPRITISATPSKPGANLLKNADFSAHDGDKPADWEFQSAVMSNFEWGWDTSGRAGPGSLRIKTHTGRMSGYWGQTVTVTPGAKLMVWAWVRTAGGRSLLYLVGGAKKPDGSVEAFDQRSLLQSLRSFPLAGLWINPDYMRGPSPDEWVLVAKVIHIPEGMMSLGVEIGSYFARGEMWVDDMYAGPARMDLTVAVDCPRQDLQSIVVTAAGKTVLDAGKLPAGTRQWHQTLPGLDADLACVVKAATADGKVTTSPVFPPESAPE